MSFPCAKVGAAQRSASSGIVVSGAGFIRRARLCCNPAGRRGKAAGVSKGTLYLYYSSKKNCLKPSCETVWCRRSVKQSPWWIHLPERLEELFRTLMRTWWESVGNTKLSGLPKLMMAEAGNFPELSAFYQEEVIERGERMVASMLRRGMERKEIRPMIWKIDARLLISPMIMMMMWKHSTGVCKVDPEKLDDYLAHYIELALHGLRPDKGWQAFQTLLQM
jgi:AcrR family transcriptional regulator